MQDLLVKLYELEDDWRFVQEQAALGITIRKPIGPEKPVLLEWVREHFMPAWSGEADTAVSNVPKTCFIAVKDKDIIGFGCYDASALGFFGPIGVLPEHRRSGIGKALLHACLLDMKNKGYGYAIIGQTNHVDWYHNCVGAVPIEGSEESIWKTWVQEK